ncbi:MAG: putative transcriptional regulator [Methanobacterium sp. Maddingley MBC34]|nr:MAG: putative transcriptional regulator [Methanobacterium sp. Maddingley MBC34]
MDDESTKEKPPEDSRDNLPADELEKIEFKKSRGYYRDAMDSQDLFGNLDQFEKKLVRGVMRGSGPIIMLWLISKKGQHGYEIMTQLHESSPFRDKIKMPSASIIYPKLHQLEKKGLIKGTWETHGKRKVKYYEITPEGVKTLEKVRSFFKARENHLYEDFLEDVMCIKNNRS